MIATITTSVMLALNSDTFCLYAPCVPTETGIQFQTYSHSPFVMRSPTTSTNSCWRDTVLCNRGGAMLLVPLPRSPLSPTRVSLRHILSNPISACQKTIFRLFPFTAFSRRIRVQAPSLLVPSPFYSRTKSRLPWMNPSERTTTVSLSLLLFPITVKLYPFPTFREKSMNRWCRLMFMQTRTKSPAFAECLASTACPRPKCRTVIPSTNPMIPLSARLPSPVSPACSVP